MPRARDLSPNAGLRHYFGLLFSLDKEEEFCYGTFVAGDFRFRKVDFLQS
jgi:hypothetical protein